MKTHSIRAAEHGVRHTIMSLVVLAAMIQTGCKPAEMVEEPETSTEVTVQVAQVKRATLHTRVNAYGFVEPEPAGGGRPAGAARLAAPSPGVVLEVPVKEGDHVDAGGLVVKLDDRLALANLSFAEQTFERQKKLLALEDASQKTFQEAEQQLAAAHAQLALVHLTTPIAGVVASINVQPGQVVDVNTVLAEVVDLNRLVVTVNVPTSEAATLKTGQPAQFFAGNTKTPVTGGKVYFISPQVDAKTGTVVVRLTIAADAGLLPGQQVRATIVSGELIDRLVVPVASVVMDGDGHGRIAVVSRDMAGQLPVKVGARDAGLVEIEGDGLKEGDIVVTVGAYGLPDQTRVKIVSDHAVEDLSLP